MQDFPGDLWGFLSMQSNLSRLLSIPFGFGDLVSDYFGVSYDDKIYYISTNPNLNVVKHDVNKGANEFRDIQDSKILNSHFGGNVQGIQVGNYYWIFGGFDDYSDNSKRFDISEPYSKTKMFHLWVAF